jgi:hypothetical protein
MKRKHRLVFIHGKNSSVIGSTSTPGSDNKGGGRDSGPGLSDFQTKNATLFSQEPDSITGQLLAITVRANEDMKTIS